MLKIPEGGLIHFLLYWLREKNKEAIRTVLIKARYLGFTSIVLVALYYRRKVSNVEVSGTPYRISGTLEFSSCVSIAADRRALSERAKHASFARRSDNRRRSARGTKFHLVPRFCTVCPELRTLNDYFLNCYIRSNFVDEITLLLEYSYVILNERP